MMRSSRYGSRSTLLAAGALAALLFHSATAMAADPETEATTTPAPATPATDPKDRKSQVSQSSPAATTASSTTETGTDAAPTAPRPSEASPTQRAQGSGCRVTHVGCLNYGISFSLLRIRAERNPAEFARERNYRVKMEGVPTEFGFHFNYGPASSIWRIGPKSKPFQLFTVGGMLLVGIDGQSVERGNVSMGATLGTFENAIMLGFGFDLFRGIAARGPAGPGTETVPTGPIGWALSRRGEVTAENVFFVVTANIGDVLKRLSGSSEE